MLITGHWSVSPLKRLRDYHLEFALIAALTDEQNHLLRAATSPDQVDFDELRKHFVTYKNFEFGTATSYGTWDMNRDPRDGTPNVEIAMLGMDGTDVVINGPWGDHPYTKAHAWMHAAIIARVAQIKGIDTGGSFDTSVEPSVLQNGPIHNISTHGERAYQTNDQGQDKIPKLGYFAYSGDSECRWDLAALDPSDAHLLGDEASALSTMLASAAWIRQQAHAIKVAGITDLWGLDGPVTP